MFSSIYHAQKAGGNLLITSFIAGFVETIIWRYGYNKNIADNVTTWIGNISALIYFGAIYNEIRKSKILQIETKDGEHYQLFAGWKTRKIYRTFNAKMKG